MPRPLTITFAKNLGICSGCRSDPVVGSGSPGKCVGCRAATTDELLQWCRRCSDTQGICERCGGDSVYDVDGPGINAYWNQSQVEATAPRFNLCSHGRAQLAEICRRVSPAGAMVLSDLTKSILYQTGGVGTGFPSLTRECIADFVDGWQGIFGVVTGDTETTVAAELLPHLACANPIYIISGSGFRISEVRRTDGHWTSQPLAQGPALSLLARAAVLRPFIAEIETSLQQSIPRLHDANVIEQLLRPSGARIDVSTDLRHSSGPVWLETAENKLTLFNQTGTPGAATDVLERLAKSKGLLAAARAEGLQAIFVPGSFLDLITCGKDFGVKKVLDLYNEGKLACNPSPPRDISERGSGKHVSSIYIIGDSANDAPMLFFDFGDIPVVTRIYLGNDAAMAADLTARFGASFVWLKDEYVQGTRFFFDVLTGR